MKSTGKEETENPEALAVSGESLHIQEAIANRANPPTCEILQCYALTLCFGVLLFLGLLALYAKDGIVEKEEFRIFVYGWLLIPPLAIAAILGVRFLKTRLFKDFGAFYSILLIVNTLYLLVAFAILFRLTGWTLSVATIPVSAAEKSAVYNALRWVAFAGGSIEVIAITTCFVFQGRLKADAGYGARIASIIDRIWPLALFPLTCFFIHRRRVREADLLMAAVLALACLFIRLPQLQLHKNFRRVLDCIAGIVFASLVFDTQMHNNPDDYEAFLGPVNDVLGGRSMLVETNCQYGVGLIYFLAAIFKISFIPRTFSSLSAVISLLYSLQYVALYAILRSLTRSLWLSITGMLLMVVLNNYTTVGYASASPSIGPLRFGLPVLLIGLNLCRIRLPRVTWIWHLLEGVVLGLASIWSLDTMVYTLVPFAVIVIYEALAHSEWLKKDILAFLIRLLIAGACILVAHGVLADVTRERSGQWPHWDYYFDYIRLYTEKEFGTRLINPWTPWAAIPIISFASLLALAFRLYFFRDASYVVGSIVAGLGAAGVTQFIYFVGRSYINNLYHICVPVVCLACYWVSWLMRNPRAFVSWGLRHSCIFCFSFWAILAVLTGWQDIATKLPQSLLGVVYAAARHPDKTHADVIAGLIHRMKDDSGRDIYSRDAARMITKYYPNEKSVPTLLYPPSTVWALFYTGKINRFAFCSPDEDEIEPNTLRRILDAPLGLSDGDVVIVWNDEAKLGKLTTSFLVEIREQFNLSLVENPLPPITAFRLSRK